MNFKEWGWREWVVCVWVIGTFIFACSVLGIGFENTWSWLGNNSSDIASWVQAIGSIAVIYAGFGVAKLQLRETNQYQNHRDLEARRKDIQNRNFFLFFNIHHVSSWLSGVLALEKISKNEWETAWDRLRKGCMENIARLESIKSTEYPSVTDILGVEILNNKIKKLTVCLDVNISNAANVKDRESIFNMFRNDLKEALEYSIDFKSHLYNKGMSISTVEEKAELEKDMARLIIPVNGLNRTNPSDTDKPQTPQQPAAGQ